MTAREFYKNNEWNWNSFDDLYELFKLIHEELKTYSTCGICWSEVDFQEIVYSICDFKANRMIGYFWSEKELAEFMIDNLTNIDYLQDIDKIPLEYKTVFPKGDNKTVDEPIYQRIMKIDGKWVEERCYM